MSYQDTSLWKRTLGLDNLNVKPLRESFLRAHENAEFILEKIRNDFPNLTVHSINHVDSLWSVADTIIGEQYPINPLEGYILGMSFLIHDAVLSYYAFGGIDKLRETVEWKDVYADGCNDKDDEEFKKDCDFVAIRTLHARKAEGILNETFEKDNGTIFYIIDNDTYRTHFGELIGEIAASHHWSIDDVALRLDTQISPIAEVPGDWEINAQKLACILRCADAGHIDNGRAPDCILHSLVVNGVSKLHWESQNRLGQVRQYKDDPKKLLITSTRSFKKEDFAAWNVAYEAIVQFDRELKSANELLKADDLAFPYDGVCGASSKEALAEYVKTKDWEPCNFGIHTSNVKSLIETLGGSRLYGEENPLFVVLRELIQNARDAIYARSKIDKSFSNGKIIVRYRTEGDDRIIEIEDNGVGMSMNCIKNHLLDFGSSYWKSYLAKEENPGLRSSGFKSIGKYGIGFYSVFMVAKSVDVYTKRWEEGMNKAHRVEFPEGLTISPIISNCILNPGLSTAISVKLKEDADINFSIVKDNYFYANTGIIIKKILPLIVVGLDTDVFFEENGVEERIHQNIVSPFFDKSEWLKGLYNVFFDKLPNDFNSIVEELEILKDNDGIIRGILAISSKTRIKLSIETVCGLATSLRISRKGFVGYFDSTENNVNRNGILVSISEFLRNWTIKKYNQDYDRIVQSSILSNNYCDMVSYCGIKRELIDNNIKVLYSTYQNRNIEIGTMEGLQMIHRYLFAGIEFYAGNLRYYPRSVPMESFVETMPENSFESIISKFLYAIDLHSFEKGNLLSICIWVNFMLKRFTGMMIDWERVNINSIRGSYHDEVYIRAYLKGFLSTTYEGGYVIDSSYDD